MEINIITVHYHPLFFLKESLENNYKIFKKENIKFNHYLLDNNYPLESQQTKVKDLCQQYNIKYINSGSNLGLVKGKNYFHERIKPKDIIFHLETDVHLLTENMLTNIQQMHMKNDIGNITYLNNKNLNNYNKNIYEINGIKCFELNVNNMDYTWIQCCFYNANNLQKIQKIIDNDERNNYDFPGENNEEFKKENIPFLIINDFYEDMEKYRFRNYFEYEYYKAIVYYWSKFEKEFEKLTFEEFINDYDYYFMLTDKFIACYNNFKIRSKDYVVKPIFYFKKTELKFNELNMKFIINKNKTNKHLKDESLKKIGKVYES
jgi:hypothetical protein